MIKKQINVKTFGYLEDEHSIVENILKARKINNVSEFLCPDLSHINEPGLIEKMEEGAELLINTLKEQKDFFLSVDSDTDGITSGTIMYKWLSHYINDLYDHSDEKHIEYHVSQGKSHGLSEELLEKLSKSEAELLIVMDSLDASTEKYQRAIEMGKKILVVDHHDINPETDYDSLVTLVSSNRSDNPYVSGAGMVWKLCCMTDEALGNPGFTLENLSDLAAVGMIADMMDMSSDFIENRAIVNYGLNHLNNQTLMDIKGFYQFNSGCISYSIAPLINAACRYFKNDEAFRAFISENEAERESLLDILKNCKEQQDKDVKRIRLEISDQIENQMDWPYFFLVIDTEWGISGLLANQIMGFYQKPTFVVKEVDGRYAGSGRSLDFDLRDMVHGLVDSAEGYGHPSAFGFFLKKEDFDDFDKALKKELEDYEVVITHDIDCELDMDSVTPGLIKLVQGVDRITGVNFKPLKFMIETSGCKAEKTRNGKHLVFKCSEDFLFIKWKAADEVANLKKIMNEDSKIRFIGTLDYGPWGRQRFRKLILDDYEVLN